MTTIQIGPLAYQVIEVAGLAGPDSDGRHVGFHGTVDYGEQIIRIEANQSAERKWLTKWHEVVHVLFEQAGIEATSEQVVTVLGYGIPAVLQANPSLAKPEESS